MSEVMFSTDVCSQFVADFRKTDLASVSSPIAPPWTDLDTMMRLRRAFYPKKMRFHSYAVKYARSACEEVHQWSDQYNNVPVAITSTVELILFLCADSGDVTAEDFLREEMAGCLERLVQSFISASPSAENTVLITGNGKGLGISQIFSKIRDDIDSDEQLPSLGKLRSLAYLAMNFLKEEYWTHVDEVRIKDEHTFLSENYRAAFSSYERGNWHRLDKYGRKVMVGQMINKCDLIGGPCVERFQVMATVLLEPGFLIPIDDA